MLKPSGVRCVLAFALPLLIGSAFMLIAAEGGRPPTVMTRDATEAGWYAEYCESAWAEAFRILDYRRLMHSSVEERVYSRRLEAVVRNAPECALGERRRLDWAHLCRGVAKRLRAAAVLILESDDRVEEGALNVLTTNGDVCGDVPSMQTLREQCYADGNTRCLAEVALRVSSAIERRY